MKRIPFLAASVMLCAVSAIASQLSRPVKVKTAEYEPPLTGTLTNPIWRDASVFTKFQTVSPQPGKIPSQRMAVYLMFDNQNVYIALRMDDKQGQSIRANAKSAEEIEQGDWGAVCFDSQYFQVSPTGVQANGTLEASGKRIPTALKTWKVVARKVPTGWIAEMSIPFNTLGVTKDEVTMGFKAFRCISRDTEVIQGPVTASGQVQQVRFTAKKPG